ncbi:cytochrome c oxidase subunit 7C, mitochondrial-like [Ochotona curzoniae]|uniref:cytochrome c oxidase subunit 7C, mitochondrial-like n=1 Tax=Ochotona curzoniae TaxID=130825 RepID=UPI001B349CD3|nr:cytochrome c oxidase subunit 7C, mitochondrial-like [Ochotona curzoniae]
MPEMAPPFLPPSVSVPRAMVGQAARRGSASVVPRSHYEEGSGKNLVFSVGSEQRLLATMTLCFGSGLAAPFLIVPQQLLKRWGALR